MAGKGKGRRIVFKKCVYKSPHSTFEPIVSDFIFFRGVYFQKGDIVSLTDTNGDTYYAQIRGFIQDQYCEKSAAITWLLPTLASPRNRFDPSTYILGPEEDYPRALESMRFVCHAPSDYYAPTKSPFQLPPNVKHRSYIWTRIDASHQNHHSLSESE